jgi:hypothetical protein
VERISAIKNVCGVMVTTLARILKIKLCREVYSLGILDLILFDENI